MKPSCLLNAFSMMLLTLFQTPLNFLTVQSFWSQRTCISFFETINMLIHFWDLDVWQPNFLTILVSNEQFRSVFSISAISKPFIYYCFFVFQITYNYRIFRRMKLLLFKFISTAFVELLDNLLYHTREKIFFFHERGQLEFFIKCKFWFGCQYFDPMSNCEL